MDYIHILTKTTLFAGISTADIKDILDATGARRVEYSKGQAVIRQGESNPDIGIVLAGQGRSVIECEDGKAIIISMLSSGSYVGLLLAAGHARKNPVTVYALDSMQVLFIPFERMLSQHGKAWHSALIRNCFAGLSQKAMELYDRIDCLIRPTMREKILAYLRRLEAEQGSSVFTTPLDRTAMAEYLNTDRSALSRELSRMKRDGVIDYYRNSFRLM
jgi:CRP-like cAMP-binding protein